MVVLEQSEKKAADTDVVAQLAGKLIKKIEHGIETIEKLLRKGSLPTYFSGNKVNESYKVTQSPSSESYDEILREFEDQAMKDEDKSNMWRYWAWCARFMAGTLDSIAKLLPPRTPESGGLENRRLSKSERDTLHKARKRRRDLAILINSIVGHGGWEIMRAALAGKSSFR